MLNKKPSGRYYVSILSLVVCSPDHILYLPESGDCLYLEGRGQALEKLYQPGIGYIEYAHAPVFLAHGYPVVEALAVPAVAAELADYRARGYGYDCRSVFR